MFRSGIFAAAILCLSATSDAQGLRISTHVYDVSKADTRVPAQIVSTSLSLMHNGRVYDYMEAVDEVVIFEPTEKRFVIISPARGLSTKLTFDEIRHLIDGRQPRTEKYLEELTASGRESSLKLAESIRFQLNPRFSQTFDAMKGTLVLSAPSFTYRVETRKWNDPQQTERYLAYADWTAKLNSILHPGSLFPEPRLALNQALRDLGDRMPLSVELDRRPSEPIRLRAEHQLTLNVTNEDHQRIARWEELQRSRTLREVSFRNYQQVTLVSKSQ